MTRASVCMAAYNAGPYLAPQLASILGQLGADDELVVSDDGSSDGTLAALEACRDPRLRLYRSGFRDAYRNFDFALRQARGEAVLLADQDDVWHPSKLERMLQALQDCDVAMSDCELIDGEGAPIGASYFALNHSRRGVAANLLHNSYLGCCMALRRELLQRALPIPAGVPHDVWLGLTGELFGRVRLLPEPLVRFRRHPGALSYAGGRSGRPIAARLAARARVVGALAARYAL
jgi:glycosyltransferase involved in cell wall biosynthesis